MDSARLTPAPTAAAAAPLPAWALARGRAAGELEAACAAGIALKSLDDLVRSEPVWAGCWRARQAQKCATLLLQELASITGVEAEVRYSEQRRGDQLYFVADTRKLQAAVGWEAKVGWREGVRHLTQWLSAHRVPAGVSRRLKKVTA